jgi:glyoxalase family protein
MTIKGLHHITLVCRDAQRTTDFYTQVLGLRLVKKTVNFDDPGAYHLYFGDQVGSPGSAVTFFEWPHAAKGQPGLGGTHHFALTVEDYDGLLKWKRRLSDLDIPVRGPLDRRYFSTITFQDPDGTMLEISTRGPGWTQDEEPDAIGTEFREPPPEVLSKNRDRARVAAETWSEPVDTIDEQMALSQGMHHITAIGRDLDRTHAFYGELLGMRRLKMTVDYNDPGAAQWYWGTGDGRPGTVVSYIERDPQYERRVRMGTGQTHHFALAVENEDVQLEWRHRLMEAGYRVTPVLDRVYFKSIYTNDPDGHIVELATVGPGFLVDEEEAELGQALQLPPWLEARREAIEESLKPVTTGERLA